MPQAADSNAAISDPAIRDHKTLLTELNHHYIRSIEEADVAWFEHNLAGDFMNTNPDGTFLDKAGFIAQIARGSSVKQIETHDVLVRVLGDFAIIHARTGYVKPDGSTGGGRYTDDWQRRDGDWKCVSAHVTRS